MAIFNPTRLKVQLKLAINRLKMLQSKKTALNQHQRREIALLLEKGKDESARIRVEHIIREDLLIEALEILELYCDLLLARFGLIEQYRTCDPGIAEAVNTLIWAAPRADEVKELGMIRDQFVAKYGKEFVVDALENTNNTVNPRVLSKMQVNAPESFLVERYLEEIARTYDVMWASEILAAEDEKWASQANDDSDDDDDNGGMKQPALMEPPLQVTPLPASVTPPQQADLPQEPASDTTSPTLDLPDIPFNLPPTVKKAPTNETPAAKSPEKQDDVDDFEALTRRLAALKRK